MEIKKKKKCGSCSKVTTVKPEQKRTEGRGEVGLLVKVVGGGGEMQGKRKEGRA